MKRFLAGLVVGVVISGTALGAGQTYKGYPVVRVLVDGREVRSDIPAVNMDGRTMVPLRVVSESLGADVAWDQSTATASVTSAAAAPAAQTPTVVSKTSYIGDLLKTYGSTVTARDNHIPGTYTVDSIEVRSYSNPRDTTHDKVVIVTMTWTADADTPGPRDAYASNPRFNGASLYTADREMSTLSADLTAGTPLTATLVFPADGNLLASGQMAINNTLARITIRLQ